MVTLQDLLLFSGPLGRAEEHQLFDAEGESACWVCRHLILCSKVKPGGRNSQSAGRGAGRHTRKKRMKPGERDRTGRLKTDAPGTGPVSPH